MPDIDRYPTLGGQRIKVATPEDVLTLVRATWPEACQHGSTGFERSWTSITPDGLRLVAHSWSPTRDMAWFWVRVAATWDDTLDEDMPWMGSPNSRSRARALER